MSAWQTIETAPMDGTIIILRGLWNASGTLPMLAGGGLLQSTSRLVAARQSGMRIYSQLQSDSLDAFTGIAMTMTDEITDLELLIALAHYENENKRLTARLKEAMNDLQEGAVIITAYRAEIERMINKLANYESEVVRSHAGNDALRAEVERLEKQLELSANAWKEWEGTLKQRDNEIARLRALLKTAKVNVATDERGE